MSVIEIKKVCGDRLCLKMENVHDWTAWTSVTKKIAFWRDICLRCGLSPDDGGKKTLAFADYRNCVKAFLLKRLRVEEVYVVPTVKTILEKICRFPACAQCVVSSRTFCTRFHNTEEYLVCSQANLLVIKLGHS